MRLVIDGQRLSAQRTGVGRCLEALLADWAETGWPLADTRLVVDDPATLRRLPAYPGLTRAAPGPRRPGIAWQILGLGRTLRRGDLLLAPANVVPPTWRGRTLLLIHDALTWSVPAAFPWHVRLRHNPSYRLAAGRANRVVVPSEATAREVIRVHGLDPGRLAVAHPGPEPDFRPLPADSAEVRTALDFAGLDPAPYFLFIGKRSRRRHVPELLDAFARHREARPRDRLVFVGPGPTADLPGRAAGVVALGYVPEVILIGLLCGARALVYPSDFEGFGLPVVEAMACGCPVITLRNSALIESAGEAAFFLEDVRPATIAAALNLLAADTPRRERLVTDGLRQASRFSRARFAATVKAEVLRVAGGP